MFHSNNRSENREYFFEVWKKYQNKHPLDAMESKVLSILQMHPELHILLNDPEKYLESDFFAELGESNPFLHLGLHTAVMEQLSVDQPKGIRKLFNKACQRFADEHEAYHCVMNSLAIELHEMYENNRTFNEALYFKRIKKAIRKGFWTGDE